VTDHTRPSVLPYAAFVLTGIVTTLLGPLLPVLVGWWALDDARAGLLFSAQFAGSMAGSVLSSAGMTRIGFRQTMAAGAALMALGVGTLGASDHLAGTASIGAYGVGLGLIIPATNVYVARAYPGAAASALSLVNFAWGVGAVGAPAIVALFQRTNNVRAFLFALAVALAIMAGSIARMREPARPEDEASGSDEAGPLPARTRRMARALPFGVLLFLYVGTETSVAGWVALYARRLDLVRSSLALATPSLFWAALLAGRALAPIVLRRVAEPTWLTASLLAATAGMALLAVSRSTGMLVAAVSIAGLGLAAGFPLIFALFTRELGRDAARAAGSVFVLASLGGAALPPLVGIVSDASGSLAAGLLVPLAGCLALQALRARGTRPVTT
jgi:fucose permease